jgi:hypothetical protein
MSEAKHALWDILNSQFLFWSAIFAVVAVFVFYPLYHIAANISDYWTWKFKKQVLAKELQRESQTPPQGGEQFIDDAV